MATKAKDKTTLILSIVLIVFVVLIAALLIWNAVKENGVFLRNTTAVTSDHYTIDGAMMSVYYNGSIQSYQNQAYYYAYMYTLYGIYSDISTAYSTLLGYSTSQALNKQVKNTVTGETWRDYFMDQTTTQVTEMLEKAEAAYAAGYTLTEEQLKSVDSNIETIQGYADQNSVSLSTYIASMYGSGVQEADLRRALELELLATEYEAKVQGGKEDALTEARILEYYEKNPKNYSRAEFYTFSSGVLSDEQYALAKDLANQTTTEDFLTAFRAFLKNVEGEGYEDEELSLDDYVDGVIEKAKASVLYEDAEDGFQTWLFGDTWSEKKDVDAAVGMTIVTDQTSTTDTASKKVTVMHVISLPEKNNYLTEQNVSFLPIVENDIPAGSEMTLAEYAESLLERFEASEKKDADALKALNSASYDNIAKYDSSSSTATIGSTEADAWIVTAKVGEYNLVKSSATTTVTDSNGNVVKDDNGNAKTTTVDMYYIVLINSGEESWHKDVADQLVSDDMDAWLKDCASKYGANIKFNDAFCDTL